MWKGFSEVSTQSSFFYRQADALQDFLQGFGLGFGMLALAVASFPSGWGGLIRKEVDIDELEGTHFIVELSCPGSHRRFVDDVDNVTFL